MFVRTIRQSSGLTTVALIGAIAALLTYPHAVSTGISRGLSICGTVIIPTLFPFMLLSGILAASPICRCPNRLSAWLSRCLFGLPPCCGPIILLSMVGGYPSGMMAAAGLYRQGQITREQIQRMSLFCIGAGPGFVINTVGVGLMRSSATGAILFAVQTVVSLGMGMWLGRKHRHDSFPTSLTMSAPLSAHRIISDTCSGLVTLCGYVLLSSMTLALIQAMGLSQLHSAIPSTLLTAVLEVSSGCIALAGLPMAPLWMSAVLSWGGIAVHGQVAAAVAEERILTPRFYAARLCHCLFSATLAWGWFALFPTRIQTSVGAPQAIPYSVSMQGSAMLLLLCFTAMLCFSEKKTGNCKKNVI